MHGAFRHDPKITMPNIAADAFAQRQYGFLCAFKELNELPILV